MNIFSCGKIFDKIIAEFLKKVKDKIGLRAIFGIMGTAYQPSVVTVNIVNNSTTKLSVKYFDITKNAFATKTFNGAVKDPVPFNTYINYAFSLDTTKKIEFDFIDSDKFYGFSLSNASYSLLGLTHYINMLAVTGTDGFLYIIDG